MNFSAVILAGGPSTRMGRDKAWLPCDGQTLLERQAGLARTLQPRELFVSGRADANYSAFGLPVLPDATPGMGPLPGILAALKSSTAPLVLALAVDLPFMQPEVLEILLARCDEWTGVVPAVDRRLESLAAFYPTAAASVASRMLKHGMRSMRAFVENCRRLKLVRVHHVSQCSWPCFADWNRPASTISPPPPKDRVP
ncbi:MAG: molybdenum cofactor guanylyltransferase [Verrucomicrobiales bacterium]|nr:molybdenum cofactor guanylyltransferase [Verrucomicrobiales bacterium]